MLTIGKRRWRWSADGRPVVAPCYAVGAGCDRPLSFWSVHSLMQSLMQSLMERRLERPLERLTQSLTQSLIDNPPRSSRPVTLDDVFT